MAEEVRFELTVAQHHDGFQDRSLKPLGHPSAFWEIVEKQVSGYDYTMIRRF